MVAALATISAAIGVAYSLQEPPYAPPVAGRLPDGGARGVSIAPTVDALTFARYRDGERLRLLRVESYDDGIVRGIALDALTADDARADPVTLMGHASFAEVMDAIGNPVTVEEGALVVPFDGRNVQIAIGGNYPSHMAETTLEESFLFPKMRPPERFDAAVSVGGGLLDYEMELGFVPLPPGGVDTPTMGLVLATDYTDREILLRRSQFTDIESGIGFTDAKSRRGYMPVGNLFVVPRDTDRFYRTLELRLYVNGTLRQVALPGEMVWDMGEIVRQSVAARDRQWEWQGGLASLPIAGRAILPRTVILSGTTDGVVFRPPSVRQVALGILEGLSDPRRMRDAMVGPAIREAKRDRRYLQPDDEVVGIADRLGIVRNRIVP
ncbi:fumarylacetoacetate hydrolase family protein [Aureimonas jatrophae]|uniref:2-keto-4-pentenoate hydratase/2-oxohepta-3-ene-1,7-dioic acid hydratase (Catechol pathway) n=1 Tax=Aureimonas jatrophae TaxID=1166073 RepID=A0A1H0K9Q6_9HYPH|nr:fumarylacetoacetate hydrolase family protein [Aureimonas jatrophae]MBB3951016.1 2-keto-4-pentenoate hydratase/2-oxohepta-3-ene-1,7-dioic acid hydratase in catechol pathway [Aureimonas jatrophae]SDO52629.1 2-keto-4-pentenoate hydratase/2-oxohepta-3-ene-1,7-dioic acid hydratase (catechol pathway) [Aureimonas jatrophae]